MKKLYIEKRDRYVFRLVLDLNNEVEKPLIQAIEPLKKQRKFATILRNGLRLMLSLMDAEQALVGGMLPAFNALSLLEVLFPKVCEYIATRAHNAELEQVRRELSELRARMETQHVAPPAPKIFRIANDDDEPVLDIKRDSSTDAGQNLINSLLGMV